LNGEDSEMCLKMTEVLSVQWWCLWVVLCSVWVCLNSSKCNQFCSVRSLDFVTFCGVTLYYVHYFEDDDSKFLPEWVTNLNYSTFRDDGGLVLRLKLTNINFTIFKRGDSKYLPFRGQWMNEAYTTSSCG
jgi:hypothetical protein